VAEHRLGTPDLTDTELSASDYARVVWRQRGLILVLGIVVVLTTLVTTLVSSRIYESAASVIAPKEGPGNSILSGLALTGLAQQLPNLSLPSLTPNRDLLISVLKSRTMALRVVERFKLQERYRVRYLEDTIKRARHYGAIASDALGIFPEGPEKRALLDVVNFCIERAY